MTALTCNARWMDNNFIDLDSFDAGSITASSALVSFPARNLSNSARSKLWKPAGNFEITTSNNKIYIDDGSPKTVTITSGNFTPAALATQITTDLNAASSGWTVTYDLTTEFKFTIVNSGSVTLRFSVTTDALWDDIGYTLTVDTVGTSFKAQEQRNHTDEWYQLDAGAAVAQSAFMVVGLIDEVFNLSTNAVIKLQASNVDIWTAPPLDLTITRSDRGLFNFFDDLDEVTRTYRYWRFFFQDKLNPRGPEGLSFGHMYIGDFLTTDSTNMAGGFGKTQVDPSVRSLSDSGAAFFDTKTKYHSISAVSYQVIFENDRLNLEQLYNDFGKDRPLFVAIDPKLEVSPTLDELTYYANFDGDVRITHLFRDKYSVRLVLREAV